MTTYFAVVHKTDDIDYTIEFPDFPGCISGGVDLDDARSMAQEALSLHTEVMSEEGRVVPSPSTLSQIDTWLRENKEGSFHCLIEVNLPDPPTKIVRVNITMDSSLLAAVDLRAQQQHSTRSAFLADACRIVLQST